MLPMRRVPMEVPSIARFLLMGKLPGVLLSTTVTVTLCAPDWNGGNVIDGAPTEGFGSISTAGDPNRTESKRLPTSAMRLASAARCKPTTAIS